MGRTVEDHNGTFHLGEVVGVGSYGTVYKGWKEGEPETPLAIKEPHADVKGASAALHHEWYLSLKAEHPNVVGHVGLVNDKGSRYLVLEYVPVNLQDLITGNDVTEQVVIDYLHQIPDALEVFQEEGLSHCDLKTQNVGYKRMKSKHPKGHPRYFEGAIKVFDLGLMVQVNGENGTAIPLVPTYAAPEVRALGRTFPKSDTYNAGRILECLLTGSFFDNTRNANLAVEMIHGKQVRGSFEELIMSMTDQHPGSRPSPDQMRVMAERAIETLPGRWYNSTKLVNVQRRKLFNPLGSSSFLE